MGELKPRSLPRFNGEDFPVWKTIVKAHLIAIRMYEVVIDNYPTPYGARENVSNEIKEERLEEIDTFKSKDDHVMSLLLLSLEPKYVKQVMSCHTSRDMWERLSSLHEQSSRAVQSVKRRQFNLLKLGKNESISDYIARAEYLYGQLQDIGVKGLEESGLVDQIVCGLPAQYHSFISNWDDREEGRKTLNDLISRLTAEELSIHRFFRTEKPKEESAMVASTSKGDKNNKSGSKEQFKKKKT